MKRSHWRPKIYVHSLPQRNVMLCLNEYPLADCDGIKVSHLVHPATRIKILNTGSNDSPMIQQRTFIQTGIYMIHIHYACDMLHIVFRQICVGEKKKGCLRVFVLWIEMGRKSNQQTRDAQQKCKITLMNRYIRNTQLLTLSTYWIVLVECALISVLLFHVTCAKCFVE